MLKKVPEPTDYPMIWMWLNNIFIILDTDV